MLRLEQRLKTRFEQGLTADIQPPDYEMREALLKNKAAERGISLPKPEEQVHLAVFIPEVLHVDAPAQVADQLVDKVLALHVHDPAAGMVLPRPVIRTRFQAVVEQALKELFSFDVDVALLLPEERDAYARQAAEPFPAGGDVNKYTFERFVVGSTNEFAYTAAVKAEAS